MLSQQASKIPETSSAIIDSTLSKKLETTQRPVLKYQPTATFSSTGSPPADCTSPDMPKDDTDLSSHLSPTFSKESESLQTDNTSRIRRSPILTNDPPPTSSGKMHNFLLRVIFTNAILSTRLRNNEISYILIFLIRQ